MRTIRAGQGEWGSWASQGEVGLVLGLEGALVDRGRCEDERADVDGGEDDGEREECVEERTLRLGEHLAHTRADDGGRHLRRNIHGH